MQKLLRYGLYALLLASTLSTPTFAASAHTCSAEYIIVDEFVMCVVPNQYMQASTVQVTVKTNTGYTVSQQTTPGAMVSFNLPDGTSKATVATKYKVGESEIIIIEIIDM